jgi:glutamate carboxypeptidase
MQAEMVASVNPKFGKHVFLSNHAPGWQGPTVALISHLDTVFPPEEEIANDFHWRPEGERIYGPGTVDIKGGTALIHLVLSAMQSLNPALFNAVRWLVCIDASEETLSTDFGQLVIERLPPSNTLACLVFEGGTPHPHAWPLVVARKGRAEFRVTTQGRGAHAGNFHHLGANAIVEMAHTILDIAALTDYNQKITFTPGVIHGGSVVNRVPHAAELKVEMRAFDLAVYDEGIQKMLALQNNHHVAAQDGFTASVHIEVTSRNAPWPENPGAQGLFEIWRTAAARLGMQIEAEQRGGLSDANLLWQKFPTLDGLGPCGENAHCSERSLDGTKETEYVLPGTFIPKARLTLEALTLLVAGRAQ